MSSRVDPAVVLHGVFVHLGALVSMQRLLYARLIDKVDVTTNIVWPAAFDTVHCKFVMYVAMCWGPHADGRVWETEQHITLQVAASHKYGQQVFQCLA